jgi:hypothetical protein
MHCHCCTTTAALFLGAAGVAVLLCDLTQACRRTAQHALLQFWLLKKARNIERFATYPWEGSCDNTSCKVQHFDLVPTGTGHVLVVTGHSDSTACVERLQLRNGLVNRLGASPI